MLGNKDDGAEQVLTTSRSDAILVLVAAQHQGAKEQAADKEEYLAELTESQVQGPFRANNCARDVRDGNGFDHSWGSFLTVMIRQKGQPEADETCPEPAPRWRRGGPQWFSPPAAC